MQGVSATLFQPEGLLTRGQIVTILYRLAGSPAADCSNPFTDVKKDRYYTAAVSWAYEQGIVLGVTSTLFRPEQPVTREQLVTFLARYAKYQGADVSTQGALTGYPDAKTVSDFALASMTWAVEQGLIQGIDGNLVPRGTATRAQIATIIQRYYQIYSK